MMLPMLGMAARMVTSQATISGIVSLASSDGWMRTIPKLSQRCAPLLRVPMINTSNSNTKVSQ